MEPTTYFLKGIFIGFAMAVPIGPIGIMCIRKTLTEGRLRGLIVGLGAATADLLFSCIAAFGLTVVSNTIFNERILIRLAGGSLLLFLGGRTFRNRPADPDFPVSGSGIFRSYLSTLFLTLTNPLTIFAFIAVFAALGLGSGFGFYFATVLVLGVFSGSSLWFLFLSSGVTLFRKKLNRGGLRWVNRISGALIIVSGLIAMASLL
jgi:threonine/homoserine/homoserine lactone efflux protein